MRAMVGPGQYSISLFECKRVLAGEKHWIFFRDTDPSYRIVRQYASMFGHGSFFDRYEPPHPPVCSEGYEYTRATSKADQDPIFKSAGQLSAAFLGLIERRFREIRKPGVVVDIAERYIPVLVTNADLFVVDSDFSTVSLETGELPGPPLATAHNFVILKHPFPTPEGMTVDFRDSQNPPIQQRYWGQLQKESIYVVKATALAEFLVPEHLDYLRTAS